MSCFITLKEKGLRLTRPRRVILDYIHDKGDHLTAEGIISHVHTKLPRVNKSTIYRTLDLLEQTGCVYKSESHNQFIYHHAEEGHHHHLICRQCGKTVECQEDIFQPVEKALERRHGFRVNLKHVLMTGLCRDCRSRGD